MGGSGTNFAQAGLVTRPSPSIWADCPNRELIDLSHGFFLHDDFLGGINTGAAGAGTLIVPGINVDADAGATSVYINGRVGGFLDIITDNDDNDAWSSYSEPLGPITRRSGKKFWFEIAVELGDVTMDGGIYVGLTDELTGSPTLARDVIADGAASLATQSLIGFQVLTDNPDAVDIVYRKGSGTVVEVASDVTNSTALALANRASLVNDTAVKLGLRFDGRDTLRFYVNGVQVASQDVDNTIDQTSNYSIIFSIKTGTTTSHSFAFDFLRFAFQDSN